MAKRRNTVRNVVIVLICCVVVAVVAVVAVGLSDPIAQAQIAWRQPPRTNYDNLKLAALTDGGLALTVGDSRLEVLDPGGGTIHTETLPTATRTWNIIPAADGGLYMGTSPGGIIAFDAGGHHRWWHPTDSGDYTRIFTGADGRVYGVTWTAMPAAPPTLITVLEPTGELVAEFEVPIVPGPFHNFNAGPDGSIYLATDEVNTVLYSFNVDGTLNWERILDEHPDPGRSACAEGEVWGVTVADDLIVVAMRGVGLKALDATGEPRWEYSATGLPALPNPPHYTVGLAGDVLVAGCSTQAVGLDLAGNRLWVTELPGHITEVNVSDGRVFIEVSDSSLGRYKLAQKLMMVDKELAADVRYDHLVFELDPAGVICGDWLLPAGTILRTAPDGQGRAYGTYNVEQGVHDPATGKGSIHLVALDLPAD